MMFLAKIAVSLAVAGAAVWGFFGWHRESAMKVGTDGSARVEQNTSSSATSGTQVSVKGSSDASLQADLGTIDGQLQAASNDSASVGESMNDKPVTQTE